MFGVKWRRDFLLMYLLIYNLCLAVFDIMIINFILLYSLKMLRKDKRVNDRNRRRFYNNKPLKNTSALKIIWGSYDNNNSRNILTTKIYK